MADAQCAQCALHCSEIPWRCSFRGVHATVWPRIGSRPRAQEAGERATQHGSTAQAAVVCSVWSGSQGHCSWVRGDRTRCRGTLGVSLRPNLLQKSSYVSVFQRAKWLPLRACSPFRLSVAVSRCVAVTVPEPG